MDGSKPFVINQSHLKAFLNCQRLYGWYRIAKLEPVGRRSAPEIGTAVHAGLAVLHTEGATLDDAMQAATEKLSERSGPQLAFEDKTQEEAQAIVDRVLPAYEAHWTKENDMWAPLAEEVQFLVEIQPGWWHRTFSGEVSEEEGRKLDAEWLEHPSGIFLRGRADNLSIMRGGLYLVDYKTAARMDPRDLLKYEMDLQLTAYLYGLTKQLTLDSLAEGGAPVEVQGAIIDLLVKTAAPQFARELYTRSLEEMNEFELEFFEYGQRIRAQNARIETGEDWKLVFPKNTEHCFRYGTCPFRDLCLKDTPTRRAVFNSREPDYVDEAAQELLQRWKEQHEKKT
jgi:hypothetical protein